MSYKIGVIGDKQSIMPFKLLGFKAIYAGSQTEIRQAIEQLADQSYGLIFITETAASLVLETIERYKNLMIPTIILIPTHKGSQGIGMSEIQENIEKAIGQNIL